MDRRTKLLLNSLHCPICFSQIDYNSGDRVFNYACVNNSQHYQIDIPIDLPPPLILKEQISIDHENIKYVVSQSLINTIVLILPIDLEGRIIEGFTQPPIQLPYYLFDFQRTDRDKIINRIRTILTLQ